MDFSIPGASAAWSGFGFWGGVLGDKDNKRKKGLAVLVLEGKERTTIHSSQDSSLPLRPHGLQGGTGRLSGAPVSPRVWVLTCGGEAVRPG